MTLRWRASCTDTCRRLVGRECPLRCSCWSAGKSRRFLGRKNRVNSVKSLSFSLSLLLNHLSSPLTDTLVADIRLGHMMRAQLAIAPSLPALGLGGEALVALNVVGAGIAQSLCNRVTLLGVVLRHRHVPRATDTDAVGHRETRIVANGVRGTLGLTRARIRPWNGKCTG